MGFISSLRNRQGISVASIKAAEAAKVAAAQQAAAAKAAADRARGATKPTVLPSHYTPTPKPTVLPPTQPKPTVLPSHYTPKPMVSKPVVGAGLGALATAGRPMRKGGTTKMAKGGSASSRGDGIARKGKTRGKIV